MTQRVNDKIRKLCDKCQSNLDKPCAWLSLGNEYCDEIMEAQKEIDRLNNIINELEKWAKSIQLTVYRSDDMPVYQRQDVLDKLKELKEKNNDNSIYNNRCYCINILYIQNI